VPTHAYGGGKKIEKKKGKSKFSFFSSWKSANISQKRDISSAESRRQKRTMTDRRWGSWRKEGPPGHTAERAPTPLRAGGIGGWKKEKCLKAAGGGGEGRGKGGIFSAGAVRAFWTPGGESAPAAADRGEPGHFLTPTDVPETICAVCKVGSSEGESPTTREKKCRKGKDLNRIPWRGLGT